VIAISSAALAAAVLSCLSPTHGFPVAAWLAIGLAVLAATPRLAGLSGLRLRGGRLRYRRPSIAALAVIGGVCALLPLVTFVLGALSLRRVLDDEHQARLRESHPGVENLLPPGVKISAHHRALSRCWGEIAADSVLKELLDESLPRLGSRQPTLRALTDRVRKAPESAVTVIDRHDREIRFGYFIVYPLREEAVRRILDGGITVGGQLTPADLAASAEASAGSYVSVIWAPGPPRTRRCVIATLVESLAATRVDGRARPVFACPATAEGLSLMQEYGFSAISGKDDIWLWTNSPVNAASAHVPPWANDSASRSTRSTLPPARALQSASDQPRRRSSVKSAG
jgi:hypothetical protein